MDRFNAPNEEDHGSYLSGEDFDRMKKEHLDKTRSDIGEKRRRIELLDKTKPNYLNNIALKGHSVGLSVTNEIEKLKRINTILIERIEALEAPIRAGLEKEVNHTHDIAIKDVINNFKDKYAFLFFLSEEKQYKLKISLDMDYSKMVNLFQLTCSAEALFVANKYTNDKFYEDRSYDMCEIIQDNQVRKDLMDNFEYFERVVKQDVTRYHKYFAVSVTLDLLEEES